MQALLQLVLILQLLCVVRAAASLSHAGDAAQVKLPLREDQQHSPAETDCSYDFDDDKWAPWTASVKYHDRDQKKNFAPGAILDATTIITYGRTLVGLGNKLKLLPFTNYTVYVGRTEFNVTPSEPLLVSYVKPFPQLYRDSIYWMANQNDFILLHLATPIPQLAMPTSSSNVRPLCLLPAHSWEDMWGLILNPNTSSLVGGWKRSRDLDLLSTELRMNSFDFCEQSWKSGDDTKDYNFTNRICAYPTTSDPNNPCISKDSGVVLRSPDKKHYFLGFINTFYRHNDFCGPRALQIISLASPAVLEWVKHGMRCGPFQYACHDGRQCVSVDSICDQKRDCNDGSDEDHKYCRGFNYCHSESEFECGTYGPCIPKTSNGKTAAECNGFPDCPNGEDEENCVLKSDSNSKKPIIGGLIGASVVALLLLPISFFLWRRIRAPYRNLTDAEINDFFYGHPELEEEPNSPLLDIRRLYYDTQYEYEAADCELGHIIDSGAFGVVRFAKLYGHVVAVKIPRVGKIPVDAFISLLVELKIMQYIKMMGGHENVVKFIGAHTKNIQTHVLQVAMEYCPLGDLSAYLRKNRQHFTPVISLNLEQHIGFVSKGYVRAEVVNQINPLDLVRWCLQVARGMAFLALNRLLHGDLAGRNVLLGDNRTAKVSDFGLTRQLNACDEYTTNNERDFPLLSAAPEVLESNGRVHNIKSDVYSFGVLTWEIFSFGAVPWAEYLQSSVKGLLPKLKSGAVLGRPQHASEELYALMLKCWNLNADDRPDFQELVDKLDAIYIKMAATGNLPYVPRPGSNQASTPTPRRPESSSKFSDGSSTLRSSSDFSNASETTSCTDKFAENISP